MTTAALAERRRLRVDNAYAELKATAPEVWRRCVQTADVLAINHKLDSNAAAAIEAELVEIALDLIREVRS